jgi:hypothetical protein
LRGAADIDRDGRIDVDEIYKYVSQMLNADPKRSSRFASCGRRYLL